jgi:hypothetical protein
MSSQEKEGEPGEGIQHITSKFIQTFKSMYHSRHLDKNVRTTDDNISEIAVTDVVNADARVN